MTTLLCGKKIYGLIFNHQEKIDFLSLCYGQIKPSSAGILHKYESGYE